MPNVQCTWRRFKFLSRRQLLPSPLTLTILKSSSWKHSHREGILAWLLLSRIIAQSSRETWTFCRLCAFSGHWSRNALTCLRKFSASSKHLHRQSFDAGCSHRKLKDRFTTWRISWAAIPPRLAACLIGQCTAIYSNLWKSAIQTSEQDGKDVFTCPRGFCTLSYLRPEPLLLLYRWLQLWCDSPLWARWCSSAQAMHAYQHDTTGLFVHAQLHRSHACVCMPIIDFSMPDEKPACQSGNF